MLFWFNSILKFTKAIIILSFILLLYGRITVSDELSGDKDINTALMRATYKIQGGDSLGTVFLLGRPVKNNPNSAYAIMVTATHVLDNIKGDKAILYLRKKIGDTYEKIPHEITIRKDGKNLWVSHKDVDVSAIYVLELKLPEGIDKPPLIPITWLADDGVFKDIELHPGDELLCLGYPLGHEANQAGFPVLRGGKIASFPILPTKEYKSILFDFQVYRGNSGGPVYFVQTGRIYKGKFHEKNQFIVGLVSEQRMEPEVKIKKGFVDDVIEGKVHPLGLAVVVPAIFIKETIELLPSMD